MLKDSIRKYHTRGGTESLEQVLQVMVREGILGIRNEKAVNGRAATFFCIPAVPIPTISINTGKNEHNGNEGASEGELFATLDPPAPSNWKERQQQRKPYPQTL